MVDDESARRPFEEALGRRLRPDCRRLTAESSGTGLELLDQLTCKGTDVGLAMADLSTPDLDGVSRSWNVRAPSTPMPNGPC